jgi:cation diffusion facilitator family transporter
MTDEHPEPPGRRGAGAPVKEEGGQQESKRTVVVAIVANLAIAVVKGIAALLTGSAGMLAETAHSIADSGNEVLLFVGLRKSVKAPDRRHPFGSGQERYFWALLAALGIFVVGGLLSVLEGVRSLLSPEPLTSPWIGIGVLLAAACFEAYSWWTAHKQIREGAKERQRSIREHLDRSSDPSASTVLLEDTAALIGIALALVGLVLHKITGQAMWDGLASIAIGMLLMVVAVLLSRRAKSLLVDEAAPDDVVDWLREQVAAHDWVHRVEELNAMYVGPSKLLLTTRVSLAREVLDGSATDLVHRLAELRHDLQDLPEVAEVALTVTEPEPTAGGAASLDGHRDTPVPRPATGG